MPSQEILTVAEQLVNLALRYNWRIYGRATEISAGEINILFTAVATAGFEPKAIHPGQAFETGSGRGGDCPSTPVNTYCPYYVLGQNDDYGDNPATKWLDKTIHFVASNATTPLDILTKKIAKAIEDSMPLEPIQLTPEGDLLIEHWRRDEAHARDDNNIGSVVGTHKYCGGMITRGRATENADALLCGHCPIRVLIPKETETYGMLREYCANILMFHRAAQQPNRPLGSSWR